MMSPRALHIVLAEDSRADVILFKEVLRSVGLQAEVRVFSDGEECADHFKTTEDPPPDLIVIDLNLPKVDGFDLIRVVRGQDRFDSVPIAVLTSSKAAKDKNISMELGANTFVTKPTGLDDFVNTVGSAIRVLLPVTGTRVTLHITCGSDPKTPSGKRRRRAALIFPYGWRRGCSGSRFHLRR